jgi:hypothetical protein
LLELAFLGENQHIVANQLEASCQRRATHMEEIVGTIQFVHETAIGIKKSF